MARIQKELFSSSWTFSNFSSLSQTMMRPWNRKHKFTKKKLCEKKIISAPFVETDIDLKPMDISNELTGTEKEQLTNLIQRYRKLFPKKGKRIGYTNSTAHWIEIGDVKPVHCSPYRTSLKEQKFIKRAVEKLLKADIIEPSYSSCSSPLLLILKGPDEWRVVNDYRLLDKKNS